MDNEKKQLNDDQLAKVTGAGEDDEEKVHYIVRHIDARTGAQIHPDEIYFACFGDCVIIKAKEILNYSPLYQYMQWTIQKDGEIIIYAYVPN